MLAYDVYDRGYLNLYLNQGRAEDQPDIYVVIDDVYQSYVPVSKQRSPFADKYCDQNCEAVTFLKDIINSQIKFEFVLSSFLS